MSIKILTKNGIDNTNIDGARDCNFNAGNRSGIVKSVLNEGRLFSVSSNTIGLDTCELRIFGHRIVIDEIQYKTFTSIPSSPVRYALVAQVSITETVPTFALNVQSVDTVLRTDNINNGNGIYEIELGRFTHNTDGSVVDIVRTIDIITGGISGGNSEYISIGDVTTNTLDPNLSAEVDVENRKTPEGKMITDFSFSIPRGLQGVQGEKGATGAKIVSTVLQGQDANGGNIYKQTFDNGLTATFTAPKGAKGDKGDKGAIALPIVFSGESPGAGSGGTIISGTYTSGYPAAAMIQLESNGHKVLISPVQMQIQGSDSGKFYNLVLGTNGIVYNVGNAAYAILRQDNVKTLFGNQSIYGSGNIDLYNHTLIITGATPNISTIHAIIMFTSSSNTKIDSLTDLYTACSKFGEMPASGHIRKAGKICPIYSALCNSGDGIHFVEISANDTSGVAWTEMQIINITDTVTTV